MVREPIGGRPALTLMLVVALIAAPAFADKPPWAGGGKGRPDKPHPDQPQAAAGVEMRFTDRQKVVLREYFVEEFRQGRCPPGLAKKRNGCMPPGQAKKWRIGYPMPPDVVYYDLPPAVIVKLGPPPPGHRYVRVAADILLIAVGTAMVVDAIEDLGRL